MSRMILLKHVGCKSNLGRASKMPCATYSLPAQACKVGQALAKIPGSVCHGCYADGRGNYRWQSTQDALYRRLASVWTAHWAASMATLIRQEGNRYFRWHDSGDLQSLSHLIKINMIAHACPETKFWLPTRETGIVSEFMRRFGAWLAPNLIIRLSATMIDATKAPRIAGLPVSYVHTGVAARVKGTKVCPAPKQDGHCGECRNCWNPTIDVSYHKH